MNRIKLESTDSSVKNFDSHCLSLYWTGPYRKIWREELSRYGGRVIAVGGMQYIIEFESEEKYQWFLLRWT